MREEETPDKERVQHTSFLAESLARGIVTSKHTDITNGSGCFNIYEFRVLILPDVVKDKSAGGVYIPDPAREAEARAVTRGYIVAMSPAAFDYYKFPDGYIPKIGDRVLFAKHGGLDIVGDDGRKYRLIDDKNVLSRLAN